MLFNMPLTKQWFNLAMLESLAPPIENKKRGLAPKGGTVMCSHVALYISSESKYIIVVSRAYLVRFAYSFIYSFFPFLYLPFKSSTNQRRSRLQRGYCIGVSRRSAQATAGK